MRPRTLSLAEPSTRTYKGDNSVCEGDLLDCFACFAVSRQEAGRMLGIGVDQGQGLVGNDQDRNHDDDHPRQDAHIPRSAYGGEDSLDDPDHHDSHQSNEKDEDQE